MVKGEDEGRVSKKRRTRSHPHCAGDTELQSSSSSSKENDENCESSQNKGAPLAHSPKVFKEPAAPIKLKVSLDPSDHSLVLNLPADREQWDYIGAGGFGYVYKYQDPASSRSVAIKCIKVQEDNNEDLRCVKNEISIHRRLCHPNIVMYYSTMEFSGCFMVLMEYVAGGSLFSIIERQGPLNDNEVISYTHQTLKGLVYLHDKKVIHRDLRSRNILISDKGIVKLADFGISKDFTESVCSQFDSQVGNPHWRAPELIEGRGKAGSKVDVWSLGITMFEMLTCETPWGNIASEVAQYHIYRGTEKLPLPASVPAEISRFINLCLERDYSKRLRTRELIKDVLFKDVPVLKVVKEVKVAESDVLVL